LLTARIIAWHIGQVNGLNTDSVVLDACPRWSNLAAAIITRRLPSTGVMDLAAGSA
jgi:hypothetical protein